MHGLSLHAPWCLGWRRIGAIARGERNFTTDTLERVAKALRLSIFELFAMADNEP